MTISNKLNNKLARWMDTFDAMDGCIDVLVELVGWLMDFNATFNNISVIS